jgi:hypothetical protein
MFDFAIQPAPELRGVLVELATNADALSAEWFPHLRRGMTEGLEAARERGREWIGLRIEVRRIHIHLVATTADACDRYGRRFIVDRLPHLGVQIQEQMPE